MLFSESELEWIEQNQAFLETASIVEIYKNAFRVTDQLYPYQAFEYRLPLAIALLRNDFSSIFLDTRAYLEDIGLRLVIKIGVNHYEDLCGLLSTIGDIDDFQNKDLLNFFIEEAERKYLNKEKGRERTYPVFNLASKVAKNLNPETQVGRDLPVTFGN